jgi:D-3-phosphoglycerate dehydrogenase
MPEDFLSETGIEMMGKDRLLEEADFVSLNCTLNPTSRHIIAARELALMKPTAYLINTARGPLVDEPALVGALQTGAIAGAGMDVFEHEPLPQDSPLRQMENCMLAAHNANASPAAWERVHVSTVQNLVDELRARKR